MLNTDTNIEWLSIDRKNSIASCRVMHKGKSVDVTTVIPAWLSTGNTLRLVEEFGLDAEYLHDNLANAIAWRLNNHSPEAYERNGGDAWEFEIDDAILEQFRTIFTDDEINEFVDSSDRI